LIYYYLIRLKTVSQGKFPEAINDGSQVDSSGIKVISSRAITSAMNSGAIP
jgi:hypothetical protein